MSYQIQLREGTAATWASANPVLAQGEEGHETDTGKRKVGDGSTAWNALPYWPSASLVGAAPLASPAFTGTPTAPTASPLTDDTQVATTAYADAAVAVEASRAGAAEALKAPLASPALTGSPTAPTQTSSDNSTKLATTAFVATAAGTVLSSAETYAATQASAAQSAAEAASDPAGSASTAQSNAEAFATSAVATETTRAEAAEALLAPKASPAFTGTPAAPTATPLTDSTQVATTAYADSAVTATAGSRVLNNRGAIAASTAYNPGDVVAYQGQRVLITTAVTSSAWTHWYAPPTLTGGTYIPLTSEGVYSAADWGVVADGVTDNSGALNRALQFMFQGSNSGGFLMLPAGYDVNTLFVGVAGTVIIPPNCFIVGQGIQVSAIKLLAGANCDVIQFQTYDSTAQSTILSAATGSFITPTSVRNAYYAGLMHLTVDGNRSTQSAASYHYGVNITTSPQSSEAPSDSSFDPTNFLFNVEVTECTGDGLYHYGRGQLRVAGCLFRNNNGCGAVTSFDSLYTGCNFGFNGLGGVYVNYASCNGAANKSYNNGAAHQWASGSSYAAGTAVMYNGALYRAVNALTNDTVVPSSDTVNWAALAASAPQAWGTGFYFDSNASENTWTACDAQENTASDYYLHGCLSVSVQGVSANTAYLAASNPNYYSTLVLDGAAGCLADISFARLNSIAYALRVVNGAARNDVRMTGDTTYAAVLSPDSLALVGSGNSVKVNGASVSDSTAPAFSATGLTGATAATRYAGATASGAPASGSFLKGDYVIDQTGAVWICTAAGSPGTWAETGGGGATLGANTFTGNQTAPAFIPSGLTGATAASRYAGATTSGAPVSGTFAKGDWIIDQTGVIWICTTAGTPGTWTELYPGTGLTNPMTTAGDTIYGGSSGTPSRLPGSTSTQKLFLSQTGTGSASAAPAWSAQGYGGLFGDGSDGAVAMNGTNTFSGLATLAGSTYTLTRDMFATSLTVSSGVTLKTNGYLIFCQGTVTNGGTIGVAGNNASGATHGLATAPGTVGPGEAGASGTSGNGVQGAAAIQSFGVGYGGASGAGSTGTAAGQLNPGVSTAWPFRKPSTVLSGALIATVNSAVSAPAGGIGGASGGGDGTNSGGGGGGGGPLIVILAWAVINNGTIMCPGGNGGTPPTGNCGGGGGGGGGSIIVYTLTAWTAGTTNVAGGTGGTGVGTGAAGASGGPGTVLNVIIQ